MSSEHDEDRQRREVGEAGEVRAVFDDLPVLLLGLEGPQHRIVAANAAYRDLVGRTELVGRTMAEVFPEIAGQQIYEIYDRVYQTGIPQVAREWHVQVDLEGNGELADLYFDFTVAPRRAGDGVIGTTLSAVDVTERVRERQSAEHRAAEAERRFERVRDLVATLQRELLPAGLPVLPGVHVTASYLPAEADTSAGGDWFDASVLSDGRVALVVGDLVGHGVEASATMGQVRAVLRDRLLDGDLEQAMIAADRLARREPAARGATVCVAVLDPADGSLWYCTAGHPPPLMIGTDAQTRYLPPTGAGPLGSDVGYPVAADRLDQGALLVLYSDGIIERPGRDHAASLVEFAQVAADAAADRILRGSGLPTTDRVCAQSIELLVRATGHTDDITMLAAQRTAPPAPLQLDLPANLGAIASAHRSLTSWMRRLDVGPADQAALQHAVGELVTNSVEHAYAGAPVPGRVRLDATLAPDGQLRLVVSDDGRWHERSPEATGAQRGLGLVLVEKLVDTLHLDRSATGTTASVVHPLTRPGRLRTGPGIGPSAPPPSDTEPDLLLILDQPQAPAPRVRVDGPITAVTADQLAKELQRLTANGTRELTVDLTGTTLLVSVGVAALHHAVARARDHGTELCLYAPPGSTAHHVLTLVALPHATVDPHFADGLLDPPPTA